MKKINYISSKMCVRKNLVPMIKNDKKHSTVRVHCHYTGKYKRTAHNVWNLRYDPPKETAIVFHNGSNCDYNFISMS